METGRTNPKEQSESQIKLQKILEFDKTVSNLYSGKYDKSKYPNEESAEQEFINWLVYYDFAEKEIVEIMDKSNFSKWKQTNKEYHDLCIKKAFSQIEERYAAPEYLDDMVQITRRDTEKVQFIPGKTIDESGRYRIYIRGEVIEIPINKLNTPKDYIIMYLDRFKRLIKIMNTQKNPEWKEIVDFWGEMCENIENDSLDKEQIVIDSILSKLSNCVVTEKIQKAYQMPNYILYTKESDLNDEEREMLLYSNKNITKILKDNKIGLNFERLRNLLSPYLARNSLQKRVDKTRERFWCFDINKIDFDRESIISDINEEKEVENHEK